MKKLLCLLIYMPLLVYAQHGDKGIRFEEGLTWEAIKTKAKTENKYIFADLYTTWCGPCKKMDKEVYANDSVGEYVNAKFISVKIQMDSGLYDNERIKTWYAEARKIKEQYQVTAYPSFLFFTPDAKLVYKDLGYKNVPEFIQLGERALNPQNQLYYAQLEDYRKGEKNYAGMGELAVFVQKILGDNELARKLAEEFIIHSDKEKLLTREHILFVRDVAMNGKLADSLAREYKECYLNNLSEEALSTHENLSFINEFNYLIDSKDKIFQLLYLKPGKADEIMDFMGWANSLVESVIQREEINSRLFKDDQPAFKIPDWDKISAIIKGKYPHVDVAGLVLDYQVAYYRKIMEWGQWAKYQDQKINKLVKINTFKPADAYFELNLPAWDAFLYCNDKKVLEKALNWSDLSIKSGGPNPNCLDTRANLLYKLGRVEEAIAQQEKAIELTLALSKKEGVNLRSVINTANSFKATLDKMKKGEPTYLDQGAIWVK